MEKYLMPANAREVWFRDVVRAHPKALWIDGCEGPRVKDFEVRLRLKPDAVPKAQQPIPLGEFDQLRVDFRIEEEVALGKRVYHDPEKPRQPTLQVGLPDNKAKWIQRDEIGGLLSNAFTTTPRK